MHLRYQIQSFRFAEEVINAELRTKEELLDILSKVPIPPPPKMAAQLNRMLKAEFKKKGWEIGPRIHPELGLTADFRKKRVQIEAQFSNNARYYADVFKFELSHLADFADVGVLIVAKKDLANKIGDNIANYERVERELKAFKILIPLPILLIGVEP